MSYETGPAITYGGALTPQRARGSLNEIVVYESDGANARQLATYGKNAICGVKSGLLVPASAFSAALHTNEAGARAAFIAAYAGFNLSVPALGKREKVSVCTDGILELECVASTFVPGELLRVAWDSTNSWLNPLKFEKTSTITEAVAIVTRANPMLPKTGNVVKVMGRVVVNMQLMTTTA